MGLLDTFSKMLGPKNAVTGSGIITPANLEAMNPAPPASPISSAPGAGPSPVAPMAADPVDPMPALPEPTPEEPAFSPQFEPPQDLTPSPAPMADVHDPFAADPPAEDTNFDETPVLSPMPPAPAMTPEPPVEDPQPAEPEAPVVEPPVGPEPTPEEPATPSAAPPAPSEETL